MKIKDILPKFNMIEQDSRKTLYSLDKDGYELIILENKKVVLESNKKILFQIIAENVDSEIPKPFLDILQKISLI